MTKESLLQKIIKGSDTKELKWSINDAGKNVKYSLTKKSTDGGSLFLLFETSPFTLHVEIEYPEVMTVPAQSQPSPYYYAPVSGSLTMTGSSVTGSVMSTIVSPRPAAVAYGPVRSGYNQTVPGWSSSTIYATSHPPTIMMQQNMQKEYILYEESEYPTLSLLYIAIKRNKSDSELLNRIANYL